MIYQDLDTVKLRLRDIIQRRRQGLPPVDDEVDVLERVWTAIEDLEEDAGDCECRSW